TIGGQAAQELANRLRISPQLLRQILRGDVRHFFILSVRPLIGHTVIKAQIESSVKEFFLFDLSTCHVRRTIQKRSALTNASDKACLTKCVCQSQSFLLGPPYNAR